MVARQWVAYIGPPPATLLDQRPFMFLCWGSLGAGVMLALFGLLMHRYDAWMQDWKVRADRELAEAAGLAWQRRETRGDESMERIQVIPWVELAKYRTTRRRIV